MKKVCIQQLSLSDALMKCIREHALISCDKLEPDESIHCYNGGFYYEDGARIGETYEDTLDFFNSQAWTKDATWFVVGYLSEEDVQQLKELHVAPGRYQPGYFEKAFAELTDMKDTRILCKAKRIDTNQWTEGQYLETVDGDGFLVTTALTQFPHSPDVSVHVLRSALINKDTLSRCTGKKDQRFLRIFEHDVVRQFADCDEMGNSLYFFYAIKWDKEYARFYGEEIFTHDTVLFDELEDVVIVGNIIDTPDMESWKQAFEPIAG